MAAVQEAQLTETAAKRVLFRRLHEQGCFVIPNPWDLGSARILEHLGFAALASTSSGHAWTRGKPDYALTRDEMLRHLSELCAAVNLPVNADFKSGFAVEPEAVANNVGLAIKTGIAGLSIEDSKPGGKGLHDPAIAVERICAARHAIDQSGHDVILVARTEGMLADPEALSPAIDRLEAFAEAGADCLYAPGLRKKQDIAAMVRAIAPKPLNVLMFGPGLSVAELADLGVRRISVGGALARVTLSAMLSVAHEIKSGSFEGLASAGSSKWFNDIFAGFH